MKDIHALINEEIVSIKRNREKANNLLKGNIEICNQIKDEMNGREFVINKLIKILKENN